MSIKKNLGELAGKYMVFREKHEPVQELEESLVFTVPQGLSLLSAGVTPDMAALQTAGGIAGGFGIGMLAKSVTAKIGKRIHPGALSNQQSLLANFGRSLGQKTLLKGGAETARNLKGVIKNELKEQSSKQLLDEALQNPQAFAGKYGIDAEVFKKHHEAVKIAGQGGALLETLEQLTPEQRKAMGQKIQPMVNQVMDQGFNQTEKLINQHAAQNANNNISKMAQLAKERNFEIPGTDVKVDELIKTLLKDAKPVTGEEVGRAIGRAYGDELGVITGMTMAAALGEQMGMKSSKDKEIERLNTVINDFGINL